MRACHVCGETATFRRADRVSNGYELLRYSGSRTVLVAKKPDPAEVARVYDCPLATSAHEMHRREFSALRAGKAKFSAFQQYAIRKMEWAAREGG